MSPIDHLCPAPAWDSRALLPALGSRMEPKDYVDFYFLLKNYPDFTIDEPYEEARRKDAIFSDPPTAAFQLEEGLSLVTENPSIMPALKKGSGSGKKPI